MKANENAKPLGPDIPCWKVQDPKWTMLVVDNYKSLGMRKWQFDLVLGLQNWKIIKPKIWWSILILGEGCMNCYFLRGMGGWHVACRCLHNRNTREIQGLFLQKRGRGEKKISLCDWSLHNLGWKSRNFVQRKNNDAWVLNIISVTFFVTNYHPIVDMLCGCWWRWNMEAWRFGFWEMVWHWLYASTLGKIQIITLVKFLVIIDHSYFWTNNIVYIKFWAPWLLDI